jgi:8-oxo-dGTP pyrophosphatase MutT (NUDIX family)
VESSQESDRIGASFFTWHLVAGLRGAADEDGDGLVTLSEAYGYTFRETRRSTEDALAGPQHPNYALDLAGQGDFVMTDLRSATAMLHFDPGLDGRLWVAQRAAQKSVDPDLWDNLVGGMVSAGEPELLALEREAHEEAGLSLHGLAVRRGVLLREQRPLPEGHMVETVQVFDVALPPGFVPRSVDGEVQRFELRSADAVLSAIERGEFTIEAALVALDGLLRQEAHHD